MASYVAVISVVQALFIFSNAFLLDDDSCTHRCGQSPDNSKTCQCNVHCTRFNDCCPDYHSLCEGSGSDNCNGRCGSSVDHSKSCQCNKYCYGYNDCCPDYESQCNGGGTVNPGGSTGNCASLAAITQELWDNDVNRLSTSDCHPNYQTQIPDYSTTDKASQKFFTTVSSSKLQGETYSTFLALLDNYTPYRGSQESKSSSELAEETAFLDAIFKTKVMQSLLKYLICQGIVSNEAGLRSKLNKMWFDFYARSSGSPKDSSGFEHVLVGEYKDNSKVGGFHSWLSFYEKEKSGILNYYGYVSKTTSVIGAAFRWDNRMKPLGSFFYCVSPEFDVAIYSLCFLLHPGGTCRAVINGRTVNIKSYSQSGHIATIYPAL